MVITPRGTQIYTREEAIELFEEDCGEGMEFLVLTLDSDGGVAYSATFIGEYREELNGEMKVFTCQNSSKTN